MAWIELHQSIWTHRKTLMLAAELNLEEIYAAAHMTKLWTWALDNAQDGYLTDLPYKVIAYGAGWKEDPETFVRAAINSKWIDETEDGLYLHDWEDYAGKLMERRASEKERSRRRRAAEKKEQPKTPNIPDEQETTSGRPADDQQTAVGTVPNRTLPNNIIILTPSEHQFMETLQGIENYPYDREKDLEMYHRLKDRYPQLDLIESIKDWAEYKIDQPLKSKDNPRSQINTSFKKYVSWDRNIKTAAVPCIAREPTDDEMAMKKLQKEMEEDGYFNNAAGLGG